MNYLIRDKSFYKQMLSLMIPIALQNMITTGVGIMDGIMLGSFGDTVLSGASLGNQPSFFLMIIVFGMSSGGGVLISQYFGRGNREAVGRIIAVTMRFVIGVSILFTAVCMLAPDAVMSLFGSDPAVIEAGSRYLRVVSFAFIPSSIASCYMVSLRSVGKAGFATGVYAISFFVNIFFNYCFIFGRLGFPRLEIAGAAVGTVIARCLELAIVIIYIAVFDKTTHFRWRNLFKPEKQLTLDYVRTALPVTGSEFVWGLGTLATASIIGHISTVFVTANSIANTLQQIGTVLMFGVGNASAVLVGSATGRGDKEYALKISRTMLLVAFATGVFAMALVLLLRDPFLSLYRVSAESSAMARDIIGIVSLCLLISGIEMTCIVGVLRGGGDTRFAFAVDMGAMWLVGVPFGLIAGIVLKLNPLIVYALMRCDLPVRLALCLPRIMRGKFLKNVTRDVI